jgi:hypothetical protein
MFCLCCFLYIKEQLFHDSIGKERIHSYVYDIVSLKVKDYSDLSPKTTQPILDEPYTIEEVTEQIQSLKCRKAPGPDYITNAR